MRANWEVQHKPQFMMEKYVQKTHPQNKKLPS
jgi:hypothetical protein